MGHKLISSSKSGFTIIELVVVISVIALLLFIVGTRLGTFSFWKEDAFLKRFTETLRFIHTQAIADATTYALEVDLSSQSYRVGVLRPDANINQNITNTDDNYTGLVSLELLDYKVPYIGDDETLIPPPSFPSLFEKQQLPPDAKLNNIKLASGEVTASDGEKVLILYSPHGFSEFSVFHFKFATAGERTVFVNPFTGEPQVFNEYKDFEWKQPREEKK